MSDPEAATSHHAAPIRAVKIRGVDYVAVDDLAEMFTEMAQVMPEAKLAQVLTTLVKAMGARPSDSDPAVSEPPARPCRACGVPVRTYRQQDDSQPDVVLNAGPALHGQWMVTRTREHVLAVPYDVRKHHITGAARYRAHSCAGPFPKPGGRPQ